MMISNGGRAVNCGRALLLALPALVTTWALAAPPNRAPTVAITAPGSGATFSAPATITITATASDSDGTVSRVDFYQGSSPIGTRTSAPYTITWGGVAAGSYSLTATALDNLGASKTSAAVAITVTGAKVLIASPANGSTIYGGSATVSGSFAGATDSTVLVDNGNTTRIATLNGNSYTASVPIYYGTNTLGVTVARRDKTVDSASVVVMGNAPPLLTFTSPSTTIFDAPANITLTVDALSPAGSIGKVDFFRNGTLLGTAASAPYRFVWSNVSAGSYAVTAIATDASGYAASTSLPITVNGPNAPPVATITAPSNGASFTAPATIALSASASDADGWITLVEFLQNGSVIGVTNSPPYSMTWNAVPAGSYALTARATDNRAGVATSAPVAVTVAAPNNPPSVAMTSPPSGSSFVTPATIALAATATDSDGTVGRVDFYQGATLIGSSTTAPYSFTWTGVAAGSYTLTAKATDNRGAVTTSQAVNIAVTANNPPSVSLTNPASGASYFAPATITLSAAASDSDGSIARVDFYQGTTAIGSATSAPYTFTWSNVAQGSYSLSARAIDNQGGAGASGSVAVTVSNPVFAILSPPNYATIDGDVVNVTGTVQAPANSGVTVNGVIAAIDGTGRFYANGVPLAVGTNSIQATLTTIDGATANAAITVSSAGRGPVRITASPTQGLDPLSVTFDVAPRADVVIQRVEFDVDGNGSIDQTLTSEPWTATFTYAGVGTLNASVRVTDTSGNGYSQQVPIVLTSQAVLDQTLRAVWSSLKTALAAGDKNAAMSRMAGPAQEKFGPVFDALANGMPQIVASLSEPQSSSMAGDHAEYAVNRMIDGVNRVFLVYFTRGLDGVWRLDSM